MGKRVSHSRRGSEGGRNRRTYVASEYYVIAVHNVPTPYRSNLANELKPSRL